MTVFKKIVHCPREGETMIDWLRGLFDVGELPKDALWLDAAVALKKPEYALADDICQITYFSHE